MGGRLVVHQLGGADDVDEDDGGVARRPAWSFTLGGGGIRVRRGEGRARSRSRNLNRPGMSGTRFLEG